MSQDSLEKYCSKFNTEKQAEFEIVYSEIEKQAFLGTVLNAAKPLLSKGVAAAKPLLNKGSALVAKGVKAAKNSGAGQRAAKFVADNPTVVHNTAHGAALGATVGGITGAASGAKQAKADGKNRFVGAVKGTVSGALGGGAMTGALAGGITMVNKKFAGEDVAEINKEAGAKDKVRKSLEDFVKKYPSESENAVKGAIVGALGGGAVGLGSGGYKGYRKAQKDETNKAVGTVKGAVKGMGAGALGGALIGGATPLIDILQKKASDEQPDAVISVQTPGEVKEQILTAQPDGSVAEQIITQPNTPSEAEKAKQREVAEAKAEIRNNSAGTTSVLPNGLEGGKRRLMRRTASDLSSEFGEVGDIPTLSKLASPSASLLEAMEANGEYDEIMKEAEAELTRVLGDMSVVNKKKIKDGPREKPTPEEAEDETEITPQDSAELSDVRNSEVRYSERHSG